MVPLQLLVAFLIGWFQRGQSEIIEYLREEKPSVEGTAWQDA